MKDQLSQFVSQELLNGLEVGHDDDLLLTGLVDSIGVMRLVAFVEEQTGKQVPPEDVTIENFANISAIARYLEGRGA